VNTVNNYHKTALEQYGNNTISEICREVRKLPVM